MSGKRVWNMKELRQKLERLIETAVEKEEIAGANIVVIRDGQEMAFAAGGYADIEAGKKIRTGYDRKAVFHDKTSHVCGCHAFDGTRAA